MIFHWACPKHMQLWGGTQKKQFILTCFNFSHLQSTLHLMQYTYWDVYFHCSKQFLNLSILMPFSASAIFLLPLPRFSWRTFFIQGNKKSRWGEIGWIGRVGHGGHAILVKNRWTLSKVWVGALKESSKNFTEAKRSLSQQHQLIHWHRWVPRTSPSRVNLYYKEPISRR